MGRDVLQIFLPSYVLIFIAITFFWSWLRKTTRSREYSDIQKNISYPRLRRLNALFLVVFVVFAIMTLIYVLFPDLYYIFLPIDSLDHPFINSVGILLLKVALVWMIVAQLHIDKELYKYSRKISDLSLMELVHFSEKMFLGGLVVMFIGMFVTITNVVGIIIGIIPVFLYYRTVLKYKPSN